MIRSFRTAIAHGKRSPHETRPLRRRIGVGGRTANSPSAARKRSVRLDTGMNSIQAVQSAHSAQESAQSPNGRRGADSRPTGCSPFMRATSATVFAVGNAATELGRRRSRMINACKFRKNEVPRDIVLRGSLSRFTGTHRGHRQTMHLRQEIADRALGFPDDAVAGRRRSNEDALG